MDLHEYQMAILQKLIYKNDLRFTDLKIENLTSEHFTYHLKKLIEKNLIKKTIGGYELTIEGKDFIGRIDTVNLNIEKNPKVSVLIYIRRRKDKGNFEYLMSKRLKQPYLGKVGNITGKIKFGETFSQAAERELEEETGLKADLKLNHIYHKIRIDENRIPVQDGVFAVFIAMRLKGKIRQTKEAKLFWTTLEKLYKRKDLFDDVKENFEVLLKNKFTVIEDKKEQIGF